MLQILLHEKKHSFNVVAVANFGDLSFPNVAKQKEFLELLFQNWKKIYNMASEKDEQDPDITQVSWTRTACLEGRTRKGSD